jgi:hypothetical protein
MSVAGTRPTVPRDELARCSRTALRCTALRCTALRFASFAAHVPDRRPGHPPRPEPGRLNSRYVNNRCDACSGPLDRRASRSRAFAWWHVGRRGADPRDRGRAARGARRASGAVTPSAGARALGAAVAFVAPVQPPAIPPAAPPTSCEGDLWGDLQCGGPMNRLAVSCVRSRREHTPPPARPSRGGSEESQAEGSVFSSPMREAAGPSDDHCSCRARRARRPDPVLTTMGGAPSAPPPWRLHEVETARNAPAPLARLHGI